MSGHFHLYQRSIMSNNAAYQDIRFHNEAKWHTRFHNRHKWNVSTAYLRHVQAQPAQGPWPDPLVARFGARRCCSGTRIWFRACMATLYAAPERRGSTMSACSRGTGTRRGPAATGPGLARIHRDSSESEFGAHWQSDVVAAWQLGSAG
jgi:hypothetical protein